MGGRGAHPRLHAFLAIAGALLALSGHPAGHAGSGIEPPLAGEMVPPVFERLLRAFESPLTPWGAGHRGADLAVRAGETVLLAPVAGRVTTGLTPGNRFVTIEPADGQIRVTLSYLAQVLVASGALVEAGDAVAVAGPGHGDGEVGEPHVHLSLRVPDLTDPSGWRYVDPMPDLRRYLRRVRLAVTHLDAA